MAPPELCSVQPVQLYMSALATSLGTFLTDEPPQYTGSFSWQRNMGICVCKMMRSNIPFFPSDVPERERRKKTNTRGTSALSSCWIDVPGGCSIYVISPALQLGKLRLRRLSDWSNLN